jgi:hypothetical protein
MLLLQTWNMTGEHKLIWVGLQRYQRSEKTASAPLRRRFEENDLPLLTKLRETMPNDTRIAFYRAHTLWAMHRFEEAYAAYDVRLKMANVSRSNPVRLAAAGSLQFWCQPSVSFGTWHAVVTR